MVTPKIQYTETQAAKLLSNAVHLSEMYRRDDSLGIRASIRHDPFITQLCNDRPVIMNKNYGHYFLLKMHFKQLRYTMRCMRWNIKITFKQFVDSLDDILETADLEVPLIVEFSIYRDGTVRGYYQETEPIDGLFAGLHDQMRALDEYIEMMDTGIEQENEVVDPFEELERMLEELDPDGNQKKDDDDELKPGPWAITGSKQRIVYIDSEATMPSYFTTFETTNIEPYIEAHARVSADYLRMLHQKFKPVPGEVADPFEEVEMGPVESWVERDEKLPEINEEERRRALEAVGDEVLPLMYNTVHQLMCAGHDFCIAVFRHGFWHTPHLGTGAKNDPLRMLLLSSGMFKESFLLLQGLFPGERILLISSVYGVQSGIVMGTMPPILYKYTRSRVRQREEEKKDKTKKKKAIKIHLSEWMNMPNGRTYDD